MRKVQCRCYKHGLCLRKLAQSESKMRLLWRDSDCIPRISKIFEISNFLWLILLGVKMSRTALSLINHFGSSFLCLFLNNGIKIFGRPTFLHFFDHQTLEIHEIHETGHFGFQLFHLKFINLGYYLGVKSRLKIETL